MRFSQQVYFGSNNSCTSGQASNVAYEVWERRIVQAPLLVLIEEALYRSKYVHIDKAIKAKNAQEAQGPHE
jgi:hypothetical protein